jgi:hypothetical protein
MPFSFNDQRGFVVGRGDTPIGEGLHSAVLHVGNRP